jgi:predicted NodU family carbamoyl transferase
MPLAGDQGAGLGAYEYYFQDLSIEWPNHLFWGHRDIDKINEKGLIYVKTEDLHDVVATELERVGLVNLVRGAMEYGPRALCNTSTLARPLKDIGEEINKMNSRTNEMPFALVVTNEMAQSMFKNADKVHKSLNYMIMARSYCNGYPHMLGDGFHYYPLTGDYTCRPQVTEDPLIVKLLNEFGPLINTSFNYHGMPIVRSTQDILYSHQQERKNTKIDFRTIVEEK